MPESPASAKEKPWDVKRRSMGLMERKGEEAIFIDECAEVLQQIHPSLPLPTLDFGCNEPQACKALAMFQAWATAACICMISA